MRHCMIEVSDDYCWDDEEKTNVPTSYLLILPIETSSHIKFFAKVTKGQS